MPVSTPIDCVIVGGGAAGLWTLDAVLRSGRSAVLLEAHELGRGQTVASHGVLDGRAAAAATQGPLRGLFRASTVATPTLLDRWRSALAGETTPDLRGVRVRAEHRYLWSSADRKRVTIGTGRGLLGVGGGWPPRAGALGDESRPSALRGCPGTVMRVATPVVDPVSLLHLLSTRHRANLLRIDLTSGLELRGVGDGWIERVALIQPETGEPLDLQPRAVVLTAGAANAELRRLAGRRPMAVDRRVVRTAMVRGAMPTLHGDGVDGRRVRLSVTTVEDSARRAVWLVGGATLDSDPDLDDAATIVRVRAALRDTLPWIEALDDDGLEWAVDRRDWCGRGGRAAHVVADRDSNLITASPSSLELVPELADRIADALPAPAIRFDPTTLGDWPRPLVALPPWETTAWRSL